MTHKQDLWVKYRGSGGELGDTGLRVALDSEDSETAPYKRRKLRGAVPREQKIACLFCRGRKIGCSGPTNVETVDTTCQSALPRYFATTS